MSPRKLLFRALAVVLGAALVIIAAEAGMRLSLPYHFSQDWAPANLPGRWRFKNAHGDVMVEINRHGMRGPETSLERTSGIKRILVIGDSMTWGEAVNFAETYPEVARRRLETRSGQRYEFLNYSRPGAGPREYLAFWQKGGRRFDPDVVVVGFFMGNDMFDVRNPYRIPAPVTAAPSRLRARLAALRAQARAAAKLRYQAIERLYFRLGSEPRDVFDLWFGTGRRRTENNPLQLANLLAQAQEEGVPAHLVKQRLEQIPAHLRDQALAFQLDPWLLSAAVLHPQSVAESQELAAEHILASWSIALAVLDELLASVRAEGASAIVLLIPRAAQVAPRYAQELRVLGFDVPAGISEDSRPQEYLEHHLLDAKEPLLDALPALRAAERMGHDRLYFEYDVHLTAPGHRVLGELLADYLTGDL